MLGRVLAARGHDAASAIAFLDPEAGDHDPFGLPGMRAAVDTVAAAVAAGELIAIYGDYDADGVTACAMLTRALRSAGAAVRPYIPNRMSEGYGLHAAALEDLATEGVGCVITVDCGTSSVAVAAGRPRGMRLVVTDHHLPLAPDGGVPQLAPVDALVNPKLPGSEYPFDGLAGAGVAFKLVQGLEAAGVVPPGSADRAVGLAALGTIADMMPLRGENRRIVRHGLPRIADLAGLRTLCDAAGLSQPLQASDVAFGVGPRINAAGRMEDARLALQLCLSDSAEEARVLAAQLDEQNRQRRGAGGGARRHDPGNRAGRPRLAHGNRGPGCRAAGGALRASRLHRLSRCGRGQGIGPLGVGGAHGAGAGRRRPGAAALRGPCRGGGLQPGAVAHRRVSRAGDRRRGRPAERRRARASLCHRLRDLAGRCHTVTVPRAHGARAVRTGGSPAPAGAARRARAGRLDLRR